MVNSCSDCESQGLCPDSQVFPKPFSCVTHRFIKHGEPEVNSNGTVVKQSYLCLHCGLQMSNSMGIILFGQMA